MDVIQIVVKSRRLQDIFNSSDMQKISPVAEQPPVNVIIVALSNAVG